MKIICILIILFIEALNCGPVSFSIWETELAADWNFFKRERCLTLHENWLFTRLVAALSQVKIKENFEYKNGWLFLLQFTVFVAASEYKQRIKKKKFFAIYLSEQELFSFRNDNDVVQ